MNKRQSIATRRKSTRGRRTRARLQPLVVLGVTVMLSASPSLAETKAFAGSVTVIDREDIELSGHASLRALLGSRMAFNSFGLYGGRFGTGLAVHLINGRNIVGVNLDTIPLAAVKRIEIRDEGPVRYSPWGLGGVINIVLRNDLKGIEISAYTGLPVQPGRDQQNGSVLWGGALGRGHMTVGAVRLNREEVRDGDRHYLASDWVPGGAFVDSTSVSIGGNTIFYVPSGSTDIVYASVGDCETSVYTGILTHPRGTVCGYPWAEVSWIDGFPRYSHENLSITARHPLGNDAELYMETRTARQTSLNRWAPSVGSLNITATGDLRQYLIDHVDGLDDANFPANGQVRVSHRFVGHGNREWRGEADEYELMVGVQGGNSVVYDARAEYYLHRDVTTGINFVSGRQAHAATESGAYDIVNPLSPKDPARHAQAIRDMSVLETHVEEDEFKKVVASLGGTTFAMRGGDVRWTVGVEFEERNHRSVFSHFDSANRPHDIADVIGTAGESIVATRRFVSVLSKTDLPVLDNWNLTLGARRDDYSDVGDGFSLHAANRFRLSDMITLRTSWGSADRPPGLSHLHRPEAIGYVHVCDPLNTDDAGRPVCTQHETLTGGNPDLTPTSSERLSVGATADLGSYAFSLDWFSVRNTKLPGSVNAQTVVDQAAAGNPLPGTRVERIGQHIDRIVNLTVQERESETRGFILHAGASWETDLAKLTLDFHAVRTTRDLTRELNVTRSYDYPRDRAHAVFQVNRGNISASWNTHYISGYFNNSERGRFKAWYGHDIALQWRNAFGTGLDLTGGILNIADRGPSLDSSGEQWPDLTVDGVRGRTFFVNATMAL